MRGILAYNIRGLVVTEDKGYGLPDPGTIISICLYWGCIARSTVAYLERG